MQRHLQGYLYLTLAMITVGSTVIASRVIAPGMAPFTATALRFAAAFPFFLVLMRVTRTRLPNIPLRDWIILVIQAGAGSVGYTTLLISGLRLTTAADAGVIIGTLPVVGGALSVAVLGERPHASMVSAIALAATGVFFIAVSPDAGSGSVPGNALVFGAVICESLFILLNKNLGAPIPALTQSALMTGIGFIIAVVAAALVEGVPNALPADAMSAVIYYALVPTVAGFILWYAGAERVSGAEASLFTAVAPVSALLMAFVVLGEPLSGYQIGGVGCVLAAVLGLGLFQRAVTTK
ncbi:drug/metabolite transporter (DMT)-like permease [Rhizobium mesoamericanum]|uniref:DMT family transporter n=1 Tax=Rhizobium mesoamericanum TaxID=1079800 RepID=UPI002781B5EE|nr:DMT family transporter [Rhizobium mesoamericanum]MDQ0562631.1 drug/metabolite transporter (DMT)-like permease [Rhizobium mesoamericanum]